MAENDNYLRNIPRQKRSLERFHHILDTADRLFGERGYDAVSTNHIAEESDVAIGSIYHFFPNKEALLQALVDRYRQRLTAVFPDEVSPPKRVTIILEDMLNNLMAFEKQQHGLEWMLTRSDSGDHAPIFFELHRQIVEWVEAMLSAQFPQLSVDARQVCALTGVAIIQGMMPLGSPPYTLPEATLKREAHTALVGYLRSFLAREGIDGTL